MLVCHIQEHAGRKNNHGRLRAEDRQQDGGQDLAVPIADATSFLTSSRPSSMTTLRMRRVYRLRRPACRRRRPEPRAMPRWTSSMARKKDRERLAPVPSITAFNANAAELANATLAAAMGGDAERNFAGGAYYCRTKCHDPSVTTAVTFKWKTVRSVYQDDAIRTAVGPGRTPCRPGVRGESPSLLEVSFAYNSRICYGSRINS